MLAKFDEGVRRTGQHVTYLATTAAAVKVLEKDGFEANTLARFLLDKDMQADARGGRVVIDETLDARPQGCRQALRHRQTR